MGKTKNNYNIPNLFIVGAPKCGTTSIHNWLSQHPEIFMSPVKEPYYLCTDRRREGDEYNQAPTPEFKYKDEDSYLSLFDSATHEKYIGESTPGNLFSEEAIQNILHLSPSSKIIIMLRDPVEFIYSSHSQKIKAGMENLENFEDALQAEEERRQHKNMPRKVTCPSDLLYTELAQFSRYIKNYSQYFSKEQIKIVVLEELKQEPERTFQEVLEFLQVNDTQFLPEFEVYNRNAIPRSKRLNHFIKNSKYVKNVFRLVVPEKLRKRITPRLEEWNKKTVKRPPMSPQTKKELMTKFRPEVEELSKMIDKDLISLWGYNRVNEK